MAWVCRDEAIWEVRRVPLTEMENYFYHLRVRIAVRAHLIPKQKTEKEWKAMADDFKKRLDKFKVPEREPKPLIEEKTNHNFSF